MIQVGIEPKRLLNEIKQNNISNVVARMPVYKGIEIIVADADTQVIEGATDSSKLGKKLEDVGISANPDSDDGATVRGSFYYHSPSCASEMAMLFAFLNSPCFS